MVPPASRLPVASEQIHPNFTQNRARFMQFGLLIPSVMPARHGHSITLIRRTDMTLRQRRPLRAIALLALTVLGGVGPLGAGANAITDWNNITTDTVLGALPT